MKPGTFNALEMARQALARRAVPFPGEEVTIYQRNGLRIYLSRFHELLLMTAVNGDPTKAERVGIGYYSVYNGWVVDLDEATYKRWTDRAMRLAHPTYKEN
jgi:hypothetical protein